MKIEEGIWKGWEVWLEYIEGERLPEHRPNYTPAPPRGGVASPECLAEVLLECLHGNDFRIVVLTPGGTERHYSVNPSVDGQRIEGCVVSYPKPSRKHVFQRTLEQVRGKVRERSMCFSEVMWVESKPGDRKPGLNGVGTIEVLIYFGTVGSVVNCNPPIRVAPQAAFDEKHKKVSMTSCVTGSLQGMFQERDYLDFTRDHFVPACRFRFNYATRDAIKAMETPFEDKAENEDTSSTQPASNRHQERDERGRFKRRTHSARDTTLPPPDEEGDFEMIDNPFPPKRRKFSIDLTNEDRPPVFVNLLQDESDDEASPSSTKCKAAVAVKQEVKEEPTNTANIAAGPTNAVPAQQPLTLAGFFSAPGINY